MISLADAISSLGHKVILVNTAGTNEWYEDCQDIKDKYERRNMLGWSHPPLDLFIDVDGYIVPDQRRAVAKRVYVFVRKPTFLQEQESSVYPIAQPVKNLRDCDGIMTWDEFGPLDAHLLELLSSKPVYRVPFTWSPSGTESYGKQHPKWADVAAQGQDLPWSAHIAETNMSFASNATLPITILAYAKTHCSVPLKQYFVHNAQNIEAQQFFKENVLAHCRRDGLEPTFVGRQRTPDWRVQPKSFVLSHVRFVNQKNFGIDVVWNGIPLVHNSPLLKSIGFGLERLYYTDNSILEATEALKHMDEDFKNKSGIFAPGALEKIREALSQRFDAKKSAETWNAALKAMPPVAVTSTTVPAKTTLRVGFSDLWQNANCTYNFWTLLLTEACREMGVKVEGLEINSTNFKEPIDLLFFGPFGQTWKQVPETVPKFHITGENTRSVDGPGVVMNFGFDLTDLSKKQFRFPLWAQYIDWFGADQARLVNPRTLPVDSVVKPSHKVADRKKFCAFVVTNPTNKTRNESFQWLSQYKEVDSAGRLFNNVGDVLYVENGGGGGGELRKHEFLKDYKFCFAYENSRHEGYITEKILAAKAAGCVPLYWGDLGIKRDFADGFIDCNRVSSPGELIEAVRAIDEDDAAWERLANVPAVDTQVERARLATVAKLVLEKVLSPEQVAKVPTHLGGATSEEARQLGLQRGDLKEAPKLLPGTSVLTVHGKKRSSPLKEIQHNGKLLLVTCSTQSYLASLMRWLETTKPRLTDSIGARVYIGEDVTDFTMNLLRADNPKVEFLRLPTKDVKAPFFEDLWNPQHFAWKLWIYQQVVQEEALANTLVWYMDCASVIVRWPSDWFAEATKSGLCMLEDAEQQNNQWCHDMFCLRMAVTQDELAAQQIVGGIMAFVAGSKLAWKVFTEAWVFGQQRDIIMGPKWAGIRPDGKPYGHRHDQSILSILRLRHKVPVKPLPTVYNHESLRRTFKSGAALYIHRGTYKEHVNFAPRIGEVHLINLGRRPDRIKRFKENHEAWTREVCLRPAFDGRQLKMTPSLARLFLPNDFLWKKAIAGCALSHLSLWCELAGEESSCENYLILEDDVKFQKGWLDHWKAAVEDIPEDYDVLYLGGVLPPNRAAFQSALEQINPYWSRVMPNQIFGQRTPTTYFHFCNYAYILSRRGAQKVLDEIQRRGGYYTSADHMICNRIEDMKHYVLTPMVAGCYQDDDPKYQQSEFNNFNRVDGFDSDLWNNDDRFTEEEIRAALDKANTASPVPIGEALMDARSSTIPDPASLPAKKIRNFYTLGGFTISKEHLLEYSWLRDLCGEGLDGVMNLPVEHEPLTTEPIFILIHPHMEEYMRVFSAYQAAGKPFYVVHLSDEGCQDPVGWYDMPICKGIVRCYPRADCKQDKVLTIPLGPYRRTKELRLLQQRNIVWSFFGTKWKNREAMLEPWKGVTPNAHTFYDSWMDAKNLTADAYSKICLNTMFVPCPRGQNVETFRFYEALEHGCIPIYVREPGDDEYFNLISKHLPMINFANWIQPLGFIQNLFKNTQVLMQYYQEMGSAWTRWKKELREQVQKTLALEQ